MIKIINKHSNSNKFNHHINNNISKNDLNDILSNIEHNVKNLKIIRTLSANKQFEYDLTERRLLAKSYSLSVFISNEETFPILYINFIGDIYRPEDYGNEIFSIIDGELNKRPIVYMTIESNGGSLDTFNIIETLLNRKADLIITETSGSAMSCGFLLWSLGHIRLTRNDTIFMIHRESFGYYGKTNEMKEHVDFIEKVFENKMKVIYENLGLDSEEIKKSKYTEIWKSGSFFIENKKAYLVDLFDIYNFIPKQSPIVVIGRNYYLIEEKSSMMKKIESISVSYENYIYPEIIENEMEKIIEMNDMLLNEDSDENNLDENEDMNNNGKLDNKKIDNNKKNKLKKYRKNFKLYKRKNKNNKKRRVR